MNHKYLTVVAFIGLCACEMEGPEPTGAAIPELAGAPVQGAAIAETEPGAFEPLPLLEPTPVDDIADLPGEYYRPFALPGQFSSLVLDPLVQGQGDYTLFRSCGVPVCVAESGTYHAVGINPAVGFAFLQLHSDYGLVDTYQLDFFWRDGGGAIVAVQMRRLLPGDVWGPTFVMWRFPDQQSEPIELATAEPVELEGPSTTAIAAGAGDPAPGLASVYVRPLPPPGELGALTLGQPNWSGDVGAGGYRIARPYCLPWCLPEHGQYEIDIANPLTGSGFLTLRPYADPGAATRYVIDGIWRNPVGGVVALQLQRVHTGGLLGAPFFMYRQWWEAGEVDASSLPEAPPTPVAAVGATDAARCVYYRNLEDYYRIRALQCAYSACYPMSPYYGWWANYYHQLAASVCAPE